MSSPLSQARALPPGLGGLVHQPAKDFAAEGGAIDLVMAAGLVNGTGLGAGLATGTVIERELKLLQERPVVVFAQELFKARQECGDELAFFVRRLRTCQPKRGEAIEGSVNRD